MKYFMFLVCMCVSVVFVWVLYENHLRIQLVRVEHYSDWVEGEGRPLDVGVVEPLGKEAIKARGLSGEGCYFAMRGRIAVKFVPWQFHAVYADIESAPADENCVYLHSYNARFKTTVYMP